jgi:hypothetical protein
LLSQEIGKETKGRMPKIRRLGYADDDFRELRFRRWGQNENST